MYKFFRNLLFIFPPEGVHHAVMTGLLHCCKIGWIKRFFQKQFCHNEEGLVRDFVGIRFRNMVGLGAGFDKNARYLEVLELLGFGFVEIGTVTPVPQAGNEKPRLFRLKKDLALVNRMGFNNDGAQQVAERLRRWQAAQGNEGGPGLPRMIVGGNIGKNKLTDNEEAWLDYEKCFLAIRPYVDYFVVNVSSPNTPGLRALQEKESLRKILQNLQRLNERLSLETSIPSKPILLKIAPDLSPGQLEDVIALAGEIHLDGIVATNTTIQREQLLTSAKDLGRIGAGGLSGAPLKKLSTDVLRHIAEKTNYQLPLIASGGVFSAADAMEKIAAGATLVQVWTSFIYEGPSIAKKILSGRLPKA